LKPLAIVLALVVVVFGVSYARADVAQRDHLRVDFEAELAPKRLPREGAAPISVSLGGTIVPLDATPPPQLRTISIAINRNGVVDPSGVPKCRLGQIQPATTANALAACGAAKVGEGSFAADVVIPEQSPFPSVGKIIAFNGVQGGRPVILAHVYGVDPIPASYTLVLAVQPGHGTFGTVLRGSLPAVTSSVAHITSIKLDLGRRYSAAGGRRYLNAGCPAPKGFSAASFPLARADFIFDGGPTVGTTLVRRCKVRR
jgi:hypothetical protein